MAIDVPVAAQGAAPAHEAAVRRAAHVALLVRADLESNAAAVRVERRVRVDPSPRVDHGAHPRIDVRVSALEAVRHGERAAPRRLPEARIVPALPFRQRDRAHARIRVEVTRAPEPVAEPATCLERALRIAALVTLERARAEAVEHAIGPVQSAGMEREHVRGIERDAIADASADPVRRPRAHVQEDVVPRRARVPVERDETHARQEAELHERGRKDPRAVVRTEREGVIELLRKTGALRRRHHDGQRPSQDVVGDHAERQEKRARNPDEHVLRTRAFGLTAIHVRHGPLRRRTHVVRASDLWCAHDEERRDRAERRAHHGVPRDRHDSGRSRPTSWYPRVGPKS